MLKESPILHDRWVAMVNSKLATQSHEARVLYERLFAVHDGNNEVQHDPNYTTRASVAFRVRVRSGLQPTQSGEDQSESSG